MNNSMEIKLVIIILLLFNAISVEAGKSNLTVHTMMLTR